MQHLRSIHYLRAVAAIMVAIFHIFSNVEFMAKDVDRVYWMRGGVDIFFVISGYVMVRSCSGQNITPDRFMLQRAQRIVPLYWIATFAMMMQVQGQWAFKMQSLLFIPAINPESQMVQPVLEPGWTLNYEMFFYAVFALSLFLREAYRLPCVALIIGALAVAGATSDGGTIFNFYSRPIMLEFLAGMAIAKFGWRAPMWVMPIGFVFMIVLQPVAIDRIYTLGIPAALIVAGALAAEKHLPDWKFANLLGSASYAIYLFHLLALGMIVKFWPLLDWGNETFAVIALTAMLATGCCMHWALEKPSIAFFKSLKARHRLGFKERSLGALS